MKARCKAEWPYRSIQACAGIEFGKVEFVTVPPALETEARANTWLEIESKPVKAAPAATEFLPDERDPEPVKVVMHRTQGKGRK